MNPVKYLIHADCQDKQGNNIVWQFAIIFRNMEIAELIDFEEMTDDLNKKIQEKRDAQIDTQNDGGIDVIDDDHETDYKFENRHKNYEIIESFEYIPFFNDLRVDELNK
jgi:hypothetical protein